MPEEPTKFRLLQLLRKSLRTPPISHPTQISPPLHSNYYHATDIWRISMKNCSKYSLAPAESKYINFLIGFLIQYLVCQPFFFRTNSTRLGIPSINLSIYDCGIASQASTIARVNAVWASSDFPIFESSGYCLLIHSFIFTQRCSIGFISGE
jgi:hypothetical protein